MEVSDRLCLPSWCILWCILRLSGRSLPRKEERSTDLLCHLRPRCWPYARCKRITRFGSYLRRPSARWYRSGRRQQSFTHLQLGNRASCYTWQTCWPLRTILADRWTGGLLDQLCCRPDHSSESQAVDHPILYPADPCWPAFHRLLPHQGVSTLALQSWTS